MSMSDLPSYCLPGGVSEQSQAGNLPDVHNTVSKHALQLSPDRSPHIVGKTGPYVMYVIIILPYTAKHLRGKLNIKCQFTRKHL